MPPFLYQQYDPSRYVNSTAQLMLRGGDIQARAAEQIGNAEAGAALGRGQAWGRAAEGIGQAVGGAIEQFTDPRRKLAAQQSEINQITLDRAKRESRSLAAFESAMKNPDNYKADGMIDDAKVSDALRKQDVGAWEHWNTISAANAKNALEFKKTLQEIDKGKFDLEDKKRQAGVAQAEYLGRLAYTGLKVLDVKPDDPLHARDTTLAMVASAAGHGAISEAQAKDFYGRTAPLGPTELRAVLSSFVPPELQGKLQKEDADTQKALADAEKAKAEAAAIKQYGSTTPPQSQAPVMRVKGVGDVPIEIVPGKGNQPSTYWLTTAQGRRQVTPGVDFTAVPAAAVQIFNANAAGGGTSLPPWALDDSRPSGPDANVFDKEAHFTPNGLFQAAMGYISAGAFPPTGRGNTPDARAQRAAIESKVGAIVASSGMDLPTLRSALKASGASLAQQQKNFDAVSGFIAAADKNSELLEQALAKMPDSGVPLLNKPLREFEKSIAGNKDMSPILTYLNSVQNEYGRILNGGPNMTGQLTEGARHEAQALLDGRGTVGQLVESIKALRLEGSNRLISVGDQIRAIMNRTQKLTTPGGGTDALAAPPPPPKPAGGRYNPKTGKVE